MDMTNENSRQYKTRIVYQNKRVSAQMNPEQIAQSIRNIAKGIHEGSYKVTKTIRILHQSGAINELTHAVYDATVAAHDTAREIIGGIASLYKKLQWQRMRQYTQSET
jgi:hypothetical protein